MTRINSTDPNTTISRPRRLRLGLALALGAVALMVAPASSLAAKFGSDLKNNDGSVTQPANSAPAHFCDPDPSERCTRVAVAFGDTGTVGGGVSAPTDGVIRKIKLVAGTPGQFRLQLARVKNLALGPGTGKAKIVEQGPRISYGSSVNGLDYEIQKFHVHVPVKEGEYLAIKSRRTSTLKCTSGSTEQLLFQPPLALGGPFVWNDDDDDCTMLLQAVIK
jgi:hypothetical protein